MVGMINEKTKFLGRCYGSTTIGGHGQTVIPVEARRELNMNVGTKLLAFNLFQGRALLLLKTEALEQLLTLITARLGEFESIAKQTSETATGSNEEDS